MRSFLLQRERRPRSDLHLDRHRVSTRDGTSPPWKKRRYLLMPFLSKKLLDWADIARLDRDGLEKGAKTKAVFPSHKKWKDHFASITGVPC